MVLVFKYFILMEDIILNFTFDDIIEKIQKVTKQKSLRISEFMRDYDPLRSGSIKKHQFLSSLSKLKIYLSRKEAEMLCNKYENSEPRKRRRRIMFQIFKKNF